MSTDSYVSLAGSYDRLTEDVNYQAFADYYENVFKGSREEIKSVLDLCCGTGTLTAIMAERGYETIGVDSSVDMLIEARGKAAEIEEAPLFICQEAQELDLYGTVDAAYSSLDSINYIPPENLDEVFRRLALFIRPGGLLIFDIRRDDWLHGMDGAVSVDEDSDVYCVWRADFDEEEGALVYGMDLFTRKGRMWQREQEEHTEYAYSEEDIKALLKKHSFEKIKCEEDVPVIGNGRLFFTAFRK